MRIEAYNQVQQLYNTKKTSQVKKTGSLSFADQVEISSMGKDIQNAKSAVAQAPDVREDVTAPIKADVLAGTYNVSAQKFADKLLAKYEEMR